MPQWRERSLKLLPLSFLVIPHVSFFKCFLLSGATRCSGVIFYFLYSSLGPFQGALVYLFVYFNWVWWLEIKIWVWGVLIVTVVALLLDSFSGQSWEIYVYLPVPICTHIYIRNAADFCILILYSLLCCNFFVDYLGFSTYRITCVWFLPFQICTPLISFSFNSLIYKHWSDSLMPGRHRARCWVCKDVPDMLFL